MEELFRSLVKINNIIGYLPCNLSQVIMVATKELKKILVHYKIKFYLLNYKNEQTELAPLIAAGLVWPVDDKIQCKAMREGLPVIVQDKNRDSLCPDCWPKKDSSYLCIPIVAGKEVLGNISLTTKENRTLSRIELEFLISVVNQVAGAIHRCRLISNLEKEKGTLAQANQEISALNQELTSLVQHLQETQNKLIHSEKLAATGRLAANVAHEINNPISIILSRLDCIFWDEDKYQQQLVSDLRVIQRQAQRIAGITGGLLSLTRKPSTSLEMIDLSALVQETLSWLEHQFQKQGIKVSLALEKVSPVPGNGELIQQVLVNLLSNAKDAMADGGVLTVSTKNKASSKQVILEIADTGHGIALEEIDKIFEPFFTSKEPGKGTGLGLFISYSIIKEHHGQIEVHSKLGQGSTFIVCLPMKDK